ncbi:GNAT family N-acetyltransferase [Pseudophaeobacter sp.]|uniref:GNAT family N-acetyltransferase n=1 Tax=Pseudophaeobacter sp. TaxID=1971739 RepID=UPI0032990F65
MAGSDRMEIRKTDPGLSALRPLIEGNQSHGAAATSSESDHTFGVEDLRQPGVQFYAAFEAGIAQGCGAFKALSDGTAEVKSVFVCENARGRGLAHRLMEHLAREAAGAGFSALVLETGSELCPQYDAARALYERLGYAYCPPIEGYTEDPMSVFMRLPLISEG